MNFVRPLKNTRQNSSGSTYLSEGDLVRPQLWLKQPAKALLLLLILVDECLWGWLQKVAPEFGSHA